MLKLYGKKKRKTDRGPKDAPPNVDVRIAIDNKGTQKETVRITFHHQTWRKILCGEDEGHIVVAFDEDKDTGLDKTRLFIATAAGEPNPDDYPKLVKCKGGQGQPVFAKSKQVSVGSLMGELTIDQCGSYKLDYSEDQNLYYIDLTKKVPEKFTPNCIKKSPVSEKTYPKGSGFGRFMKREGLI